ncbi:hypothetical protein [Salinimicrobium sp. GXAS 041]|uniref:hypothetical protein n=1 Tax=Salinimicrobium sp. GXAS 041 TaxID=3400806 RepID=UPI003C756F17
MKNLFLVLTLVFLGFGSTYAQGDLKLGFNVGLPTGDISDYSNLQVGVDAAYLFNIVDVAEVGPMVGYSHFFGEEDLEDLKFVPIAASGRINLALLVVGLDLGYAMALEDGMDGGVYYRPKVGFGFGPLDLFASYSGISVDGGSISSVNLGVEFGL